MAKKHRSKRSLLRLLLIVPALVNLAFHFFSIVQSETIIVRKSIVKLFILTLIGIALLAGAWGCILSLFIIYLLSLNLSLIFCITLILILHVLLLIITSLMIKLLKIKLGFPETRQAISDLMLK